jgi:hypothetical protein
MRMIRSLIYAGLALAAMAFTISAPAVAATPTDPGIYEAIKVSVEKPMLLQVYQDVVALNCIAPAVTPNRDDGRSSGATADLTFASTPVAVEAYVHIDPDIRG